MVTLNKEEGNMLNVIMESVIMPTAIILSVHNGAVIIMTVSFAECH